MTAFLKLDSFGNHTVIFGIRMGSMLSRRAQIVGIDTILDNNSWSQEVSRAYLHCSDSLTRDFYVLPKEDFNLRNENLITLLKSLYGLTDICDYWHITSKKH